MRLVRIIRLEKKKRNSDARAYSDEVQSPSPELESARLISESRVETRRGDGRWRSLTKKEVAVGMI